MAPSRFVPQIEDIPAWRQSQKSGLHFDELGCYKFHRVKFFNDGVQTPFVTVHFQKNEAIIGTEFFGNLMQTKANLDVASIFCEDALHFCRITDTTVDLDHDHFVGHFYLPEPFGKTVLICPHFF